MTPEKVNTLLREYRANKGRCEHLKAEIGQLEAQIPVLLDDIDIAISRIDGIPHGHAVIDPTGQIASKRADGIEPVEVEDIRQSIARLHRELDEKRFALHYVDAWLIGLSEKERWIVETHIIAGLYWREVVYRYKAEFGEEYAKETLRKIQQRAMNRIYSIAK